MLFVDGGGIFDTPPAAPERLLCVTGNGPAACPGGTSVFPWWRLVPTGSLRYLTVWSKGAAQPFVSTLNENDGAVSSNLMIETGKLISLLKRLLPVIPLVFAAVAQQTAERDSVEC